MTDLSKIFVSSSKRPSGGPALRLVSPQEGDPADQLQELVDSVPKNEKGALARMFNGLLEPLRRLLVAYHERGTRIEGLEVANERLHLETELLRQQLALAQQEARHDSLTGLPNRRALDAALKHMSSEQIYHGGHIAVLVVDMNLFKIINDTYGHDAGDAALKNIAGILRSHVRADEIVARTGGDEFCVLLHDFKAGDHTLDTAITRFRNALSDMSFVHEGRTIRMSASVGAVVISQSDLEAKGVDALKDADRLMYEAKRMHRHPCYESLTTASAPTAVI